MKISNPASPVYPVPWIQPWNRLNRRMHIESDRQRLPPKDGLEDDEGGWPCGARMLVPSDSSISSMLSWRKMGSEPTDITSIIEAFGTPRISVQRPPRRSCHR